VCCQVEEQLLLSGHHSLSCKRRLHVATKRGRGKVRAVWSCCLTEGSSARRPRCWRRPRWLPFGWWVDGTLDWSRLPRRRPPGCSQSRLCH
jgi:hypothetical protein